MKNITILSLFVALVLIPVISYGENNYSSLQGTWKLNREASSNIDELLKFQGRSGFERRIMKSMDMTQEIAVSGNAISIKVITSMKTMSYELRVDGKVHKVKNMKGEYVSVKCTPIANGVLIENEDASGMKTATQRYTAGDRMINRITMTNPDGKSITAERIFDRVK